MDQCTNYPLFVCVVMFGLVSSNLRAEPPVQLDVSVASKVTDNALKTKTSAFSERQDQLSVGLAADYENSWSSIEANYRNSWHKYEKDSQSEKTTLTGGGQLLLGNESLPIGLRVSHSSEYTLDKADDVDLLENQDRRNITTASPYVRLRLSPVDNFTLSGNYSDIDYEDQPDKNSQRQGASVSWLHRLSPTDGFSLDASRSDIDFDQFSGAGYAYEAANVSYFSQLRRLNYRLLAGVNRYKTDAGTSNSQPLYELELAYAVARHQLALRLGQRYTDSSQGNSNDVGFDSGSVGSSSDDLDIYQRNYGRASWSFTPVLERLTAVLFAEYEQEQYENLTDNNSEELGYGVDFNYTISRRNNLMLRLKERHNTFKVTTDDFNLFKVLLNYQHQLPSDFDFNAFVSYEQQRKKGEYADQQFGIRLGYRY